MVARPGRCWFTGSAVFALGAGCPHASYPTARDILPASQKKKRPHRSERYGGGNARAG